MIHKSRCLSLCRCRWGYRRCYRSGYRYRRNFLIHCFRQFNKLHRIVFLSAELNRDKLGSCSTWLQGSQFPFQIPTLLYKDFNALLSDLWGSGYGSKATAPTTCLPNWINFNFRISFVVFDQKIWPAYVLDAFRYATATRSQPLAMYYPEVYCMQLLLVRFHFAQDNATLQTYLSGTYACYACLCKCVGVGGGAGACGCGCAVHVYVCT